MGVEDSNLRVPLELEFAGREMQQAATRMEAELHQLMNRLMPLQDYWQGPAKTYYEELQAQWNFAAEGLFGDEHG
ncbi:MAG TPA: WXG100 family type VII secretion target, partial [Actinoplanes sp.]|nr:WXG100 family type VII secretion target [Actinoplanes sp.]